MIGARVVTVKECSHKNCKFFFLLVEIDKDKSIGVGHSIVRDSVKEEMSVYIGTMIQFAT